MKSTSSHLGYRSSSIFRKKSKNGLQVYFFFFFHLLHITAQLLLTHTQFSKAFLLFLWFRRVEGKLHLCSRSLVFEPNDIDLPLIKMKYSHNIALKLIKSVNAAKLQALLHTAIPVNQLNVYPHILFISMVTLFNLSCVSC
jgi:hypothetical protein